MRDNCFRWQSFSIQRPEKDELSSKKSTSPLSHNFQTCVFSVVFVDSKLNPHTLLSNLLILLFPFLPSSMAPLLILSCLLLLLSFGEIKGEVKEDPSDPTVTTTYTYTAEDFNDPESNTGYSDPSLRVDLSVDDPGDISVSKVTPDSVVEEVNKKNDFSNFRDEDNPLDPKIVPFFDVLDNDYFDRNIRKRLGYHLILFKVTERSRYDFDFRDMCKTLKESYNSEKDHVTLPIQPGDSNTTKSYPLVPFITCHAVACGEDSPDATFFQHIGDEGAIMSKFCEDKVVKSGIPSLPFIGAYQGMPKANPYTGEVDRKLSGFHGRYGESRLDMAQFKRWVNRGLLNYVNSDEKIVNGLGHDFGGNSVGNSVPNEKKELPVVKLETHREFPSPFYKSLAFQFLGSARFVQVTANDDGLPDVTTRLFFNEEEYGGSISNRKEVEAWLYDRIPAGPYIDSIYDYKPAKPAKFHKYGNADVLTSLPPTTNFFHVVAVVPNVDLNYWDTVEGDNSAVDKQLPGWDATVTNCVGVFQSSVYVNSTFDKPQILTFDLEGNILKYSDPVEALKSSLNDKIPNAVYNLQGTGAAIQKFAMEAGEEDLPAMIVFSQKTQPPGFIKNIALLMEDVVRIGVCSNPRDDLLADLGLRNLPAIVMIYHTWARNIQGTDQSKEKTLGQTVYNNQQHGKPNYLNLLRFLLDFGRASEFDGFVEAIQSRMSGGIVEKSTDTGDEEEDKPPTAASEFNYEHFERTQIEPPNDLGVYLFIDGYDASAVDTYQALLQNALDKFSAKSNSISSWFYVHGSCRTEFAELFGVTGDMLPSAVVWNPKLNRYARFTGSLSEDKLVDFAGKVAQGKVRTDKLSTPMDNQFAKECDLGSIQADDEEEDMEEMMREIREDEERREREMLESIEKEKKEAQRIAEEEKRMKEEERKTEGGGEKKKKKKKKRKKKKKKEKGDAEL